MSEKNEAQQLVRSRDSVYGDDVINMTRIAQVWSGILGHEVQPVQVPLMMAGLKLVRTSDTPDYSDNPDDAQAYIEVARSVVGPDMIQARSVAEYLERKETRHDVKLRVMS